MGDLFERLLSEYSRSLEKHTLVANKPTGRNAPKRTVALAAVYFQLLTREADSRNKTPGMECYSSISHTNYS